MNTNKSKCAIIVFCGIPGSGKSTLCRATAEKNSHLPVSIFTYDDLMPDWNPHLETDSWKARRKEIAAAAEDAIARCKNSNLTETALLLIDDNMYYRSMRYEYFQMAKRNAVGYGQVVVQCSLITALQRNAQRPRPVEEATVRRMQDKLQLPRSDNTWEANTLLVKEDDNLGDTLEAISQLIKRALENPVHAVTEDTEEKEQERRRCSSDILHQFDQLLRKSVGRRLRQATNPTEESKHLNQARRGILQEVQDGTLEIPVEILKRISDGKADEALVQLLDELLLDDLLHVS